MRDRITLPERTMPSKVPAPPMLGHPDSALINLFQMKKIGADEWTGNVCDIGDRCRLAWTKDQRQDCRHRRKYQAA
jgi:hypothetical protein